MNNETQPSHDYKKRYDDLKSHYDRKQNENKQKLEELEAKSRLAQKNKAMHQLQMGDVTDARTVHYGSERNIINDPYEHQKALSDKMRLAEFQKSKAEKIGDALAATGEVAGKYVSGFQGQLGQTGFGQGVGSMTMGTGQMFNPSQMGAHGMLVRREEDYNKRENQIKKLLWEE